MPIATVPGPMQTGAFSITEAQLGGALDKLDPILALSSKREVFDPAFNQRLTFESKQQRFNERYVYLETYFQGALFETPNSFMTQTIFPHRRYDDIYFRWDYVHFPAYPAVRTAQQAPPVKVTYETQEGSATMSRYSLAVEGLDEDQRTSAGQAIMSGLLASCAYGFLSVFELNGFRALFREPAIYQKFFFESQLYDVDPGAKMQYELGHFDVIRRTPLGIFTLNDMVRTEFSETQQLEVTDVIIPPRLRSTIARSAYLQRNDIRGDGNQQFMDLQGAAPALQDSIGGIRPHVARTYYFDGAGVVVNPMQRNIMIGDFTIQDDFVEGLRPDQYMTTMVEPWMLSVNDNNGSFQRLSIEWLLKFNSRFDADGNLRQEHYEIAQKNYRLANDLSIPAPDKRLDMFIYATETPTQTVFNVASHWGHMEKWALMDHVVEGIADTSAYHVREALGEDASRAIDNGINMITRIRKKILTPLDRAFMRIAARPPTGGTAPGSSSQQSAGNINGGHSLPTVGEFSAVLPVGAVMPTGYLPAGYGTVSGLLTIGEEASASPDDYGYISEELRQLAAEFAVALPQLKAVYECIYPKHPALSARYVPSVYRSSDQGSVGVTANALLAFGYNIVDELWLPIYLELPGGAAGGATVTPAFNAGAVDVIFTSLPDALNSGAPLALRETLGNRTNFDAFVTLFNASKFASEYKKKLQDDVARAQALRTTRTTRTVRTTRTADDEDDDAAAAAAAQSTAGSAFTAFYENEVVKKGLNEVQTVRLLSNVVEQVKAGTSPSPLTNAILSAWANGSGAAANATAGLQAPASATNGYYLTRLSVPYERLIPGMLIASPLNNGRPLAPGGAAGAALEQLRRTSLTDLDMTTIFSTARAGFRTQAESSGAPPPPRQTPLFGVSNAVPTFTSNIFVDAIPDAVGTGKTLLVVNENIRERYKNAGCEGSPAKRIAHKMFVTAPINRNVLLAMAKRNIRLPFAHIIMRPHKRYITEALIYMSMSAADPIGFTATHDPRVNYVSNGITEKFIIHVVLYTESVCTKPENVIIVPDANVSGYKGGENLVPYTPSTYDPKKIREQPVNGASAVVVMMPGASLFGKHAYVGRDDSTPVQDTFFGPIFDIRGYFGKLAGGNFGGKALGSMQSHSNMVMPRAFGFGFATTQSGPDEAEQRALKQHADSRDYPHYSSALHTNYLYRFGQLKCVGRMKECKLSSYDQFDNTVVIRARTKLSLTYGTVVPTAEIKGADHWAESCEDGCGSRRFGTEQAPYTLIVTPLPAVA